MKPEDVPATLESVQALHELSRVITARLMALEVVTDALLGTVGKSLPPLLPAYQENLLALAKVREQEISEDLRQEFRGHISNAEHKAEAMK
ncbi:hypothetical protein [Pulveribacter sp.]|uniref:hypothetical protein n=1 Tax=Pulveribacter sp. TaxID=2678893 RepID=UPI00289E3DA4|nr:hypothetical protein [Pulveribacter sp.]